MNTTRELLAAVKQRHGLTSDYQLAKFLNVSRQRISGYQAGNVTLGDETAMKVADALGIERGRVLAIVSAERTQSEQAKKEWLKLAAAVAGLAVVMFAPDQLGALLPAVDGAALPTLYIMSSAAAAVAAAWAAIRYRLVRRALALIAALSLAAGCAVLAPTAQAVQKIQWIKHDSRAELAEACAKYTNSLRRVVDPATLGCFRRVADVCQAHTLRPTIANAHDDAIESALGGEVRHCFEGLFH